MAIPCLIDHYFVTTASLTDLIIALTFSYRFLRKVFVRESDLILRLQYISVTIGNWYKIDMYVLSVVAWTL